MIYSTRDEGADGVVEQVVVAIGRTMVKTTKKNKKTSRKKMLCRHAEAEFLLKTATG